jgi:S-adenosylmethionine/arginine decarboxylase-like enzyme
MVVINNHLTLKKRSSVMGQVLVHKHIIIRAEVSNAPTDETAAVNSIKNLVDRIDMKILMGPYAKYCDMVGNRGLTVATIIETSHIVMHSWDECSPHMIQLDVYTCGAFDPKTVLDWLQQYDPVKVEYKYLDREHNLTLLESAGSNNAEVDHSVEENVKFGEAATIHF